MTHLDTIKNKTILLQTTYQPTPHLETELEIMERLLQNGNVVFWVICQGDFQTCFHNPKHDENTAIIGISNDTNHRAKGYASKMIEIASNEFLKQNQQICISAYIKIDNNASRKAFEKAGYVLDVVLEYNSHPSYHYIKKYENR